MPLVAPDAMLLDARKKGYAVGAFNVENMEMVQAIVSAAQELSAPVMLQTTPGTLRYAKPAFFYGCVAAAAAEVDVPIALHLDHGNSYDLAAKAIDAGYTSVMIDGSPLNFEENIALTSRVVAMARPRGIPVEGELGTVGGKEDGQGSEGGRYTDPLMAAEFARRTGVSSLAIAIGTAHGIYSKTPVLDIERLKEIDSMVDVPLVLHGASGLSTGELQRCIQEGICKVNVATELRIVFSQGVREYLAENPDAYDPKTYSAKGRERVRQKVMELIRICGCHGRA